MDTAEFLETGRVAQIDPLLDSRWNPFLHRHPQASVFHTCGWLEALRRTYAYRPLVFTTSSPDKDLTNGIVFCDIRSWLTGRRLVSLPFSDHCEPLIGDLEELELLASEMHTYANQRQCRYVELRPIGTLSGVLGLERNADFYLHKLDLRPGISQVFAGFHRDCVQRKIRRAERERLTVIDGRSPELLEQFYALTVRTRRRQGLPPQPVIWFKNLVDCLGTAVTIRIASKNGQPIAGMVTLEHKQTLVYKYGASDERFHNLGGMIYLLWITIENSITHGFRELDMGRSAIDNQGLVTFKEHWGATRSTLSYWRFAAGALKPSHKETPGFAKSLCSYIPHRFLSALGTVLYRHMG